MNAATRQLIAAEPVPVDEKGIPASPRVGYELDTRLWRLEWMVGLEARPFGPTFVNGRDACAASRFLRDRALA